MQENPVITTSVVEVVNKINEKLDIMSKQSSDHISESRLSVEKISTTITSMGAMLVKHDEKIESHDKSIREAETTMKVLRRVIQALGVIITLISGYIGYSVDAFLKDKTEGIIKQQVEQQLLQYQIQYENEQK